MFVIRKIRKRWLLFVILLLIVVLILKNKLPESDRLIQDDYQVKRTFLRQAFQWEPKVPNSESNSTKIYMCRNSKQGKSLIVDERGYICNRSHITQGGCCEVNTFKKSSRFLCRTCRESGCCVLYEYCVACCLHPDKKSLLKKILDEPNDALAKLFSSVTDHFELCLSKCRTSSISVQHENSYRDAKAKYCYGENPPELQSS